MTISIRPAEPTLRDRIRAVVARLLDTALSPAQDHTPLAEIDPDRYDSLGVLDCVAAVESEFDIAVDFVEDDLRVTFRSVVSIEDLVGRRIADTVALRWSA